MATRTEAGLVNLLRNNIQNSYVALIREDNTEAPVGRVAFGTVNQTSDANFWYFRNASDIVFERATTDVAPYTNRIIEITLFNASTGGNKLITIILDAPRVYLTGDRFIIPAGAFEIKMPKLIP